MTIRRLLALFGALSILIALAPFAAAQKMTGTPPDKFGQNASPDYHSSQWFAFELKFSPYSPRIDSSPGLGGKTPFADLFTSQFAHGTPPARLLTQLEFDFQFFHRFGSIGAGLSAGYYRRTTHSFDFPAAGGTCEVPNCIRSGDQTALNVIPLSLLAVYRFDVLALRYHVPLVPYFKIGLAYYFWAIQNGSGGIATVSVDGSGNPTMDANAPGFHKADGSGGTWGWVLNPGISFLLDAIDPVAARTMDTEIGINHTYLFIELHYADISGFGAANKMVLSDTTFNAGLAFEF